MFIIISNATSSFWSSLYLEGGDYGDVHHRAPPDPRPLLAVKFNQVPLIRSDNDIVSFISSWPEQQNTSWVADKLCLWCHHFHPGWQFVLEAENQNWPASSCIFCEGELLEVFYQDNVYSSWHIFFIKKHILFIFLLPSHYFHILTNPKVNGFDFPEDFLSLCFSFCLWSFSRFLELIKSFLPTSVKKLSSPSQSPSPTPY